MNYNAEKVVLYFGCRDKPGHYLQFKKETLLDTKDIPGFPWTMGHLDGRLLKNGNHPDIYNGKVFWTCGGNPLWLAFFWWDNSVDKRGGSNSGFYVRGFESVDRQAALDYACSIFPNIIARQKHPLVLQP